MLTACCMSDEELFTFIFSNRQKEQSLMACMNGKPTNIGQTNSTYGGKYKAYRSELEKVISFAVKDVHVPFQEHILKRRSEIAWHISPTTGRWMPVSDSEAEEIKQSYIETIYEELYAFFKFRVKTKKDTSEAYEFRKHCANSLYTIAAEIAEGTWKVKGYNPFWTEHPKRLINAPMYEDRIVEQWLIEKYFVPVLKKQIYPYNLACQSGKGPDMTRQIVKDELEKAYEKYGDKFYIVQFDLKKYFDNISHEKGMEMFEGYGICDFALYMLKRIYDSFHETGDMPECYAARNHDSGEFGVPKGNLPSQWTGVMLLNELDKKLAAMDEVIVNLRYMDDGIITCKDRADARRVMWFIKDYIREKDLGVELHPKKTNIYPITRGITFCGWRYSFDENGKIVIREKASKKREQYRKLEGTWQKLEHGDESMLHAAQVRNGVIAYMSKGTDAFAITHRLLQKYQIFEGEYDTWYRNKENPLGFKNLKWDRFKKPDPKLVKIAVLTDKTGFGKRDKYSDDSNADTDTSAETSAATATSDGSTETKAAPPSQKQCPRNAHTHVDFEDILTMDLTDLRLSETSTSDSGQHLPSKEGERTCYEDKNEGT